MGDECMDMYNNVEKEVSMKDLMSSSTKFDTVFNRLVYFEMENLGIIFKNEILPIIKNKFNANTPDLVKWTNIMNDVIDEITADQRQRVVHSIDGHLQHFDSDGDRVVYRMKLLSDIIGLCHQTMILLKSCMEAFENRLQATDTLGFENSRLPLDKVAENELLVEREVTNTVIAINDLKYALGAKYYANQIQFLYDWDWKKLFHLGTKVMNDAGALTPKKKETISLTTSWDEFRVQMVAAKERVSAKMPPAELTEQPSVHNGGKTTHSASSGMSETTVTT